MNLKSWQNRTCAWFGVFSGFLIMAVFIVSGVHSAQHIDQSARDRWTRTNGTIQSVGHRYGSSVPQTYQAWVSYAAGHDSRSTKVTVNVNDGNNWRTGDRLTVWYATDGATYIPADNQTKSDSPLPIGAGAAVAGIFLGVIGGFFGGMIAGFGLANIFAWFRPKTPVLA